MKKNERTLFGALLLAAAGCACPALQAQNLVVHTLDGGSKSLSLKEASRLVFADGEIRVGDKNGRLLETFAYADVNFIAFSDLPTGILPVWEADGSEEGGEVLHHNNGRLLYIGLSRYDRSRVEIYSVDGIRLLSVMPVGEASIFTYDSDANSSRDYFSVDISSLPAGTYVCTVGETSFKFTK